MIRFGARLCVLFALIRTAVAVDFNLAWNVAKYGGIVAAPGDTVCSKLDHWQIAKMLNGPSIHFVLFCTSRQMNR